MDSFSNNQSLLVTIVTALFNKEKYIEECINSVLNQSYSNWEMIIVDDCSHDRSFEIASKHAKADPRIKVIQMSKNSGAGISRNRAINLAKGDIIAFLDADDVWHHNKLKIHLNEMTANNAAFSHTSYGYIHKNGSILSKTFRVSGKPVTYLDLLKRTEISCLTAMYDVRQLGKVFMPDLPRKQDYGLWLDILSRGYTSYPVDKVLAWYRQVPGSNSSNKLNLISKHYFFLRNFQKLSVVKSFYYTIYWILNGIFKYYF